MKKMLIGFVTGAVLFGGLGVVAGQLTANENIFPIMLNGKQVAISGYEISDHTYFKLRDIASVVGGFDVDFKDDTILLSTNGYKYDENSDKNFVRYDCNIENEVGYLKCDIGGHKIEIRDVSYSTAPHVRGKLYIDDELIEDNVGQSIYSNGENIYYYVDASDYNGIYKLNLNTRDKKELIKTSEDHGISAMQGKYLYASGDYAEKILIYDLEKDEIVNQMEGNFDSLLDNYIVYNKVKDTPDFPYNAFDTYRAALDGSAAEYMFGNIVGDIIDNYVYFTDYTEKKENGAYKIQAKKINIDTREIENIGDAHDAGYAEFNADKREIMFYNVESNDYVSEEY